jgi:two-component system, OmpR family, copper resistance phosphate regulon response regulator CusR
MRLLVVEDERKVADALREGLAAERYDVEVARTGDEAFSRISRNAFDLVVLDLGLPGRDGLEVLSAIRARRIQTRVLILTARDAVQDRILGFGAGADDYLVKPFAFAELAARVRALLRRDSLVTPPRMTVGSLSLDRVAHTVTRDGAPIDLTAKEFELLEYLMRAPGQVVSRDALAREVWQEPNRGTPLDNVIDVHMTRLRRKIDAERVDRYIHTVRGVGFVLADREP